MIQKQLNIPLDAPSVFITHTTKIQITIFCQMRMLKVQEYPVFKKMEGNTNLWFCAPF